VFLSDSWLSGRLYASQVVCYPCLPHYEITIRLSVVVFWCDACMAWASNMQSRCYPFDSQSSWHCITTLGTLFTRMCLSPSSIICYWLMAAGGKVTDTGLYRWFRLATPLIYLCSNVAHQILKQY